MQDGTLVDGVPEWTVTVRVGNRNRIAESVSIDAELPSDMPDTVGGVSGVSARTGTIVWAEQQPVQERPASPWTRAASWPPTPGTSVGIWVGDSATAWKVFTGVIDSTTGDETRMVSKIIDASDRLNRRVTIPPVAHTMPGAYDEVTGAGFGPVKTFVQPWHAAYRALRAGGFGIAAPRQVGGTTILDVDLQGSIWPSIGEVRNPTVSLDNELAWGDGFTYLSQGSVTYTPRQTPVGAGSALRVWGRFAALVSERPATNIWGYSGGNFIRTQAELSADMTQLAVTVEHFDGDPNGSGKLLGAGSRTVSAAIAGGTLWWEVMIPAGSSTAYLVTEELGGSVPNGEVEQAIGFGVPAPVGESVMLSGHGLGPMVAARMGVLTPAQWRSMSSQTTSARVRAWGQGLVRSQHTSRTIERRTAKGVLDEIGAATLTSMWIDETGVMQWAPSNTLYSGTRVKTVTTAQDVFSLGWVESLLSTRRQINVNYLAGALNLSRRYGITLYQPSNGATLENGSTNEDFIDVPADEEWFGLDKTLMRIGTEATNIAFSAGHRSFYGGIYDDASGIQRWALSTSEFDYTMATLGLRTWLLEQTNTRSDGRDLQLISKDEDAEASLKKRWRNQPLPIIRGRGRTQFTDATYTASQTGPSTAPDLDFEMGSWGRAADAARVANWLAARLTTPLITLTDLEIEYDPRLQLGDVITVESLAFYGFSVDCLIIGKSEQHGDGSHLSLTVRVIRVRSTATTYEQFEAAYSGSNYAALESAWAGATYSQLEANPLGGT